MMTLETEVVEIWNISAGDFIVQVEGTINEIRAAKINVAHQLLSGEIKVDYPPQTAEEAFEMVETSIVLDTWRMFESGNSKQ